MASLGYLYGKFIKKIVRGKCVINSQINKTANINSGVNIVNTSIGRYTNIGYDNEIADAEIGSFCAFSDHVFIGGAEHPMDWVSMSPVFEGLGHSGPKKRFATLEVPPNKKTIIGNDVWIAHGAIVKAGVKIGDGVVIGSGSVVTKDIPPYAIVAGVPAKIIRYRFSNEMINNLLESHWWELKDDELSCVAPYIKEPRIFLEKLHDLRSTQK